MSEAACTLERSEAARIVRAAGEDRATAEDVGAGMPAMEKRGLASPNLLIAGFVKCGTTSIAKYLSRHPDVAVPLVKELYLLLDDGSPFKSMQPVIDALSLDGRAKSEPVGRYVDYFPKPLRSKYTLDATPYYYSQDVALGYAQENPDVRIIFLTREPASRLLSSYRFFKDMLQEFPDGTFEEFADALLDVGGARAAYRSRINKEFFRAAFDLQLKMGCYESHVARWVHHLGRSRVFVASVEELQDRPVAFMNRLCEFLAIDADVYRQFTFAPFMQSYDVRFPLLQKIGRRIAREDPMRYDRLCRYQSPFHRVANAWVRGALDRIYVAVQYKGRSAAGHASATERLREFYLPYNRKLKEQHGIDYVRSAGVGLGR